MDQRSGGDCLMGSRHNSTGGSYSHDGRAVEDSGMAGQVLMDAITSDGEDNVSEERNPRKDEVEESYEEHVEKTEITDRQANDA